MQARSGGGGICEISRVVIVPLQRCRPRRWAIPFVTFQLVGHDDIGPSGCCIRFRRMGQALVGYFFPFLTLSFYVPNGTRLSLSNPPIQMPLFEKGFGSGSGILVQHVDRRGVLARSSLRKHVAAARRVGAVPTRRRPRQRPCPWRNYASRPYPPADQRRPPSASPAPLSTPDTPPSCPHNPRAYRRSSP